MHVNKDLKFLKWGKFQYSRKRVLLKMTKKITSSCKEYFTHCLLIYFQVQHNIFLSFPTYAYPEDVPLEAAARLGLVWYPQQYAGWDPIGPHSGSLTTAMPSNVHNLIFIRSHCFVLYRYYHTPHEHKWIRILGLLVRIVINQQRLIFRFVNQPS